MTAPRCNPATLGPVCAGRCGRRMHTSRARTTPPRNCDRGHPTHDSHGHCKSCARRPTLAVNHTPTPHRPGAYCTHDEGEPCTCEAAS